MKNNQVLIEQNLSLSDLKIYIYNKKKYYLSDI